LSARLAHAVPRDDGRGDEPERREPGRGDGRAIPADELAQPIEGVVRPRADRLVAQPAPEILRERGDRREPLLRTLLERLRDDRLEVSS